MVEPQVNAEGVHDWPFDHSFPLDVNRFLFKGYGEVRPRRHDYFEVLCMTAGEQLLRIGDQRWTIRAGDVVVINSVVYHSTFRVSGMAVAKSIILYFLPELITQSESERSAAEFLLPFYIQDSGFPHIIPKDKESASIITQYVKRIDEILPATHHRKQLKARTLLKMMLLELGDYYEHLQYNKSVIEQRHDALDRLRPIFDYMENHYSEVITVQEASKLIGLSKPRFMSLFKYATGHSFVEHLNNFRIAKGLQLLENTELPVSEISQEVGFCDQSYFGLLFRRHMHMTPIQYRQRAIEALKKDQLSPLIEDLMKRTG